ncbi:hypothetical protein KP509_35G022400 [Ceratopteris richardii]|uniref:Uncharacterized protein n=1 Tax=Ceratopteris richardii TaxID=49495 RepID=A0A8T2QDY6_CERRI|nr:hypothetical protein KP509_35G022400 [Ceratopteris richardii]
MPLPTPSKLVSKRFKKPRPVDRPPECWSPADSQSTPSPLLPTLLPLSPSTPPQLPPLPPSIRAHPATASIAARIQPPPTQSLSSAQPGQCLRICFTCDDPDATDDSSDESDSSISASATSEQRVRRKRLIREIWFPHSASLSSSSVFSPISSSLPPSADGLKGSGSGSLSVLRSSTATRRGRPPRLSSRDSAQEALSLESALTSCGAAHIESASSMSSPPAKYVSASVLPSTPALQSECEDFDHEEFIRFLTDVVPDRGEPGCVWDCDLDGSASKHGGRLDDLMDLELDSDALSWINSMQRLPQPADLCGLS